MISRYDVMGPSTVTYNGALYYYIRNAQGDVTGIVDSLGDQVVTYTFDAWGKLLNTTDTTSFGLGEINPLRYRGYVYDSETELYYLKSRYYDPEMGRFISSDSPSVPTISPDSATLNKNLFSYCDNNPVVKQDSEGNFGFAVIGAMVGGVFGGISEMISGGSNMDVIAGIARGAISGAIAGAVTDFVVLSGGTGVMAIASLFCGGAMGSFVGDTVYSFFPGKDFDLIESGFNAIKAGILNVATPTVPIDNPLVHASFLDYITMPEAGKDVERTVYASIAAVTSTLSSFIDRFIK